MFLYKVKVSLHGNFYYMYMHSGSETIVHSVRAALAHSPHVLVELISRVGGWSGARAT